MHPYRLATLVLFSVSVNAAAATPEFERPALEWGFEFASAIESDERDRERAQESVALDFALSGKFDEAVSAAERIDGWRRGVALAEIAAEAARLGRAKDARRLLGMAARVRADTTGWQGPRITSHIAWAEAILGESSEAVSKASSLAEADRQYRGKAAAIEALRLAAEGTPDEALSRLAAVEAPDPDDAWWILLGHLELARRDGLPRAARVRVLRAARDSTASMAGWQAAEALPLVADGFLAAGRRPEARDALEDADRKVRTLPHGLSVKTAIAAAIARGWAAAGKPERAKRLLEASEPALEAVPPIERPSLLANLAAAWYRAGDPARGARRLEESFRAAELLENSRPRALAVVEICRAAGRFGIPLGPDAQVRFAALRAGLGDPW